MLDLSVLTFAGQMAVGLALLWAALLVAAILQVYLGLAPLVQIRKGLEAVHKGERERLEGSFPREVDPLASQVNTMLEAQRKSLAFARTRAADLAHGLKTPLAALQSTADRLRTLGDAGEAAAVENIVHSMSERIDYQLRLAQMRPPAPGSATRTQLTHTLNQVIAVLQKTARGDEITFKLDCPPEFYVRLDRHDLIELVGVILENALRHARTRVEVTAHRQDDLIVLTIADDGVGMTPEQIDRAGIRGVRFDQSSDGSGFGLAIARDIIEFNGGSLVLTRSALGGLALEIGLPSA